MAEYDCAVCGNHIHPSNRAPKETPVSVKLHVHDDPCADTVDQAVNEYQRRAKEQGLDNHTGLREMTTGSLAEERRTLWENVAEEYGIDPSMQSPK
jgi:DNA-binding NtrC family response regulator